jgi:hypothetical protein
VLGVFDEDMANEIELATYSEVSGASSDFRCSSRLDPWLGS